MKIDEYYRIEGVPSNFILKFEKEAENINAKTGKPEVSTNEWYYPKLHMALDRYVNESAKEVLPEGVEAVIAELKRSTALIKSLKFVK